MVSLLGLDLLWLVLAVLRLSFLPAGTAPTRVKESPCLSLEVAPLFFIEAFRPDEGFRVDETGLQRRRQEGFLVELWVEL